MINQGIYNNPLTGAYLFPRGDDWADIEMYEREVQERNDRVNWLWQLDLKTCPLEEIFKIDYDEVMSFGGELALGVGERLENELKNYLSPTKTGGKI